MERKRKIGIFALIAAALVLISIFDPAALAALPAEAPEEEAQMPEYATREMMQQTDARMALTIKSLLQTGRFCEAAWSIGTVEERKALLQAFIIELNRVMGLNVNKNIEYVKKRKPDAQYVKKKNKIRMHRGLVERIPHDVAMYIIIHEMRHAYQYAASKNPLSFAVDLQTAELWNRNYGRIIAIRKNGYMTQAIEKDAYDFAGRACPLVSKTRLE